MRNKKGQVALFIIVAIMLVAVILGVFLIMGEKEVLEPKTKEVSPEQFIRSCVRDAVRDKIQVVLDNAGFIESQQTVAYRGTDYTYLCYQADYYSPCYNLHPALERTVEEQIRDASEQQVRNCFVIAKENFEDEGFSVSGEFKNYDINILPGIIEVEVAYDMTIRDEETSQSFDNFDTGISSKLWELINTARDIVNAESRFCSFEHGGYMLIYPYLDIQKIDYDESHLYLVGDRDSNDQFKFAVRSCAIKGSL